MAESELPDVVGGPAERVKKGHMQETNQALNNLRRFLTQTLENSALRRGRSLRIL
jgi:hypothetical protein